MSVSIGLYSHNLAIDDLIAELVNEAVLAERVGFDGVSLGEHHGGHPGYVPQTILAISWMLGAMTTAWGAPAPILLPLRHAGLLVEELAWLAARYPGRVGAGFAPGYFPTDFEVAGSSIEDRIARFAVALPYVVRSLSGRAEGVVARDPAVDAIGGRPLPLVCSAAGPQGARRAARAGTGIILGSSTSAARARELFDEFDSADGSGARMLIRRVWIGDAPTRAVAELDSSYRRAGVDTGWLTGAEHELISGDAATIADRLAGVMETARANCLSIRLSLPDMSPEETRYQIGAFGGDVLPRLRLNLSSLAT
jgi:alkanesulfonate monooxygenase SsuD/methylene tetrahydromethanopterin reductase-like flavin-dependent oxidoreductase (luciferase family)